MRIEPGLTALIGGGGKTTLMFTLARELGSRGSVIVCTSTHILRPEHLRLVSAQEPAAVRAALESDGVICMGRIAPEGKLTAPALPYAELAGLADYVLVEADGAKGLPLKAHADYEPVIPENTRRVVLVAGADGFGRRIREPCHRPSLYAARAGESEERIVTPEIAARVILKEGYGDCLLINKAENAKMLASARELAKRLACPVIAGSLQQEVYTVCRDWC